MKQLPGSRFLLIDTQVGIPIKMSLRGPSDGELLVELGYPLSRAGGATLGFRLKTMRATYPAFYQLKEWLKTATPLGRFVNMNRLHIDQYEDSSDVEESAVDGESAGLLSSTSSSTSETRA